MLRAVDRADRAIFVDQFPMLAEVGRLITAKRVLVSMEPRVQRFVEFLEEVRKGPSH